MKLRQFISGTLLPGYSSIASASESNSWTFTYISLADSGVMIGNRLENMIQTIIEIVISQQITGKQS